VQRLLQLSLGRLSVLGLFGSAYVGSRQRPHLKVSSSLPGSKIDVSDTTDGHVVEDKVTSEMDGTDRALNGGPGELNGAVIDPHSKLCSSICGGELDVNVPAFEARF